MSTLVTVYLYRGLRTDQGANGATAALAVLLVCGDPIAIGVKLLGKADDAFWTEQSTELTAFAELLVDLYVSFHIDVYCIVKAAINASTHPHLNPLPPRARKFRERSLLLIDFVLKLANGSTEKK